jgi:hypothetical protein
MHQPLDTERIFLVKGLAYGVDIGAALRLNVQQALIMPEESAFI